MKSNLKFIMIALFTIALTACSSEDGKDGVDGQQGIPGEDGNANVKTYVFENVALTTGNNNVFLLPELTEDIVDNGVVLGYVSNMEDAWYPMPYLDFGESVALYYVTVGSLALSSTIDSQELNFKFVLIGGSSGTGGKKSGEEARTAIYDELETAGVDISDYNAVVNYYNTKN